MTPDASQLSALMRRYASAAQAGPPPGLDELCQDCPELRPALEVCLLVMGDLRTPGPGGFPASTAAGEPSPRTEDGLATTGGMPAGPAGNHPGPVIPGYELLGTLGQGGMGVVYRARQVGLQREVALKMVLPGGHVRPDILQRFRAEAEAVAALHHPGIVQVHEFGEWWPPEGGAPLPYFAQEFCPGGNLHDRLAGKPLPAGEATRLLEQVARAVQAAHERGIVHRDLKPGNILLDGAGQPKVADFGLARRLDSDGGLTGTDTALGTPAYMAPEQARDPLESTCRHASLSIL